MINGKFPVRVTHYVNKNFFHPKSIQIIFSFSKGKRGITVFNKSRESDAPGKVGSGHVKLIHLPARGACTISSSYTINFIYYFLFLTSINLFK